MRHTTQKGRKKRKNDIDAYNVIHVAHVDARLPVSKDQEEQDKVFRCYYAAKWGGQKEKGRRRRGDIHAGEEGQKRGGSDGGWFWARRWRSLSEDRDLECRDQKSFVSHKQ